MPDIVSVSYCHYYNGIENSRREFCCPESCASCGEPECFESPEDDYECCERNVNRRKICGLDGQMAPCWLFESGVDLEIAI